MALNARNNRHSVLCFLLTGLLHCLAALPGWAQTDNEDEKVYKADEFGFNALEVGQHRFFRGDKVPYEKGRGLLDHLSVGVGMRFDKIKPQTTLPFLMATGGDLYLEKEIGRLHSLQLGLNWSSYEKDHSKYLMSKTHVELAHYFDWTRFFIGYDPNRPVSMATSARVGFFTADYQSGLNRGITAALGFRASLMLNPSFYLHAEPYLAVASDKIDFSGMGNFHRYDVNYGLTASISYLLDGHKYVQTTEGNHRRFFIDYSMGPIFKFAGVLPVGATTGPVMGLGAGYWLDEHFGLRAKGNMSRNTWKELQLSPDVEQGHPAYQLKFGNFLYNGQIDLMVDLTSYFAATKDAPLSVNLLAGWQFGWITKHDVDSTDIDSEEMKTRNTLLSCDNSGLSLGAQLHWQYTDELAFYVEPRLTLANYKIPYLPPYDDIVERFSDAYFSINMGAEVGFVPHKRRQKTSDAVMQGGRLTFGLNGGLLSPMYAKRYVTDGGSGYLLGGHVDYRLGDYNHIYLGVDLTQTNNGELRRYSETLGGKPYEYDGLWHCQYKHLNIASEYRCNLSSLLGGFDEKRRLSMSAGIGPVVSLLLSEGGVIDKGELLFGEVTPTLFEKSGLPSCSVGGQFSVAMRYSLTNHIGIYWEERIRVYGNQFIAEPRSGKMMRMLLSQIGLTYTL